MGEVGVNLVFFSIYLASITFFLYKFGDVKFDFGESDIILPWIYENSECVYWVLIVAIFVGHFCCYIFGFFGKIWNSKIELPDKAVLIIQVLFYWILTLFSLIMPLIVLIVIEGQAEGFEDTDPIKLLAIFYLIVMLANLAYAYYREQTEKRKWWVYSIPLLALLGVFYWVDDPNIPKMVMKKFQLGGFTADRLLFDEGGCKILRSMALNPKPKFVKDENDKDLKECYLENIKVLSRLGRVFLLEQELECDKDQTIKFNIPKEHVLSWSKIGTKKKTETCPKDGEAGAS